LAAEYQATIEMLDPPVGKIDIGFCAPCACLFELVRETGTAYESTSWLPVCRTCRQPVSATAISGSEPNQIVRYRCREHGEEQWECSFPGERWMRVSS
jgi:hypothetical protein